MKLDENGKIYIKKNTRPFTEKKWYWLLAQASGENNLDRAEKYWKAFVSVLNTELADNAICNIPKFGKFMCKLKRKSNRYGYKTPGIKIVFIENSPFYEFVPEEFRIDGNMKKARAAWEKEGVEEKFDEYLKSRGTKDETLMLIKAQKTLLKARRENKIPQLKETEDNIEELSE